MKRLAVVLLVGLAAITRADVSGTGTSPSSGGGGASTAVANTWTAGQVFNAGIAVGGATMQGQNIAVADNVGMLHYMQGSTLRFHNTVTTPDGPLWAFPAVSNSLHLIETADIGFDFNNGPCGTSACTNPTLIVHSTNQATNQWVSLHSDTGGAVLKSGMVGSAQSMQIIDSGATPMVITFDRGNSRMSFGTTADFAYYSPSTSRNMWLYNSTPQFTEMRENQTITDATATTLFTNGMSGTDRTGGGTVKFCARAKDATTWQSTCGEINWSGVDTATGAGGETCAAAITGTNSTSASAGTFTCTATAVTGTDLCSIQLNCDTSIATPTVLAVNYMAALNNAGTLNQ